MKLVSIYIFISLQIFSSQVFSASVVVKEIPNGWRLQNNVGGNVVAIWTGSSCEGGKLSFDATATTEDKNRFWSLVMAAKIGNKRIGVVYDDSTPECFIRGFFLDVE